MSRRIKVWVIILSMVTAAGAAVIFNTRAEGLLFPPAYSRPLQDRTVSDSRGHLAYLKGKNVYVYSGDRLIWELPKEVRAQDILIADIDHDKREDLLILCWKRGRYGRSRPTWVVMDELGWSQHIFIYDMTDEKVKAKWMASDIGVHALSIKYEDDILYITDTDGEESRWKWISWGFEKL